MDPRIHQDIVPANFNASLPPEHPVNKRAAKARGVRYNKDTQQYHDAQGVPHWDKEGNPL